ncbi:MAG: DUF5716 family protein [Zoogloeaceae bacterium]|nr:DUF5716 family protein [Zoogloeaceae bacterium]
MFTADNPQCIRAFHERLYGSHADYRSILGREELRDLFVQTLQDSDAGGEDGDESIEEGFAPGDLADEQKMASAFIRQLLADGWLETAEDRVRLVTAYRFTRVGKIFAQALAQAERPRERTRQRNMRSCKNALAAFIERRDVEDLLDAHEYAHRVISDLSEDIELFYELARNIHRPISPTCRAIVLPPWTRRWRPAWKGSTVPMDSTPGHAGKGTAGRPGGGLARGNRGNGQASAGPGGGTNGSAQTGGSRVSSSGIPLSRRAPPCAVQSGATPRGFALAERVVVGGHCLIATTPHLVIARKKAQGPQILVIARSVATRQSTHPFRPWNASREEPVCGLPRAFGPENDEVGRGRHRGAPASSRAVDPTMGSHYHADVPPWRFCHANRA